jgi:hypothetical protein
MGLYFDAQANLTPEQSLAPQALTATANGTPVDLRNAFDGFAVLSVGAVSGTNPTLDVKLQESDTAGGTYTDIAGAVFNRVTAGSVSQVINVKRLTRYVRAAATLGGTSPSFHMEVVIFWRKQVL